MPFLTGGLQLGVPQNIMRAHCAVIRPDHFKFASYGPVIGFGCNVISHYFKKTWPTFHSYLKLHNNLILYKSQYSNKKV